jgi:hypothetical protein
MAGPAMVPKIWKVIGIVLLVLIVLTIVIGLAGGFRWFCDKFYPPQAEPETLEASSLRASIGGLQVARGDAAGQRFQLYASYRDADNNDVSGRFEPAQWRWNPDNPGNTVDNGFVAISTFPTSEPQKQFGVRAEAPSNTSLFDEVPLTVPSVVLLEGKVSAVCTWADAKPVVFVGAAAVGEQDPCSVALFSGRRAMLLKANAAADFASPKATVHLDDQAPLRLNIAVFIAVTARTASALSGIPFANTDQLAREVAKAAEAQARVDVDWANTIFEASRVGIEIVASYKQLDPTIGDLPARVGAEPFSCAAPRGLPGDPETAGWYDEGIISVYYVDWIDYPTDPLHPGSRGVYCTYWYDGKPAPVVFISYTRHASTTLAHELAHALGLGEAEDRLGTVNVMNNIASDGPLGASARSQFTLGQVFHMNVNKESWVNTGSADRPPLRAGPVRTCRASSPCTTFELNVR